VLVFRQIWLEIFGELCVVLVKTNQCSLTDWIKMLTKNIRLQFSKDLIKRTN